MFFASNLERELLYSTLDGGRTLVGVERAVRTLGAAGALHVWLAGQDSSGEGGVCEEAARKVYGVDKVVVEHVAHLLHCPEAIHCRDRNAPPEVFVHGDTQGCDFCVWQRFIPGDIGELCDAA